MHLPAGGAGDDRDEGELRIDVRRSGPVRIVSVGGELDRDSADGLLAALAGLPEEGLTRILVDLAELSFCDSTGLNVLLRARQDAELAGVLLELAGPRPVVVRLFAITGADAVLRIHPSVAVALVADDSRKDADPTDPTRPPGPAAPERP
ncbi:STAS domain-containing protein [Kitasatospora purpeofusca]|uniref:STAS domain-containing protein n=1 Tax=Kitasatospora purpeofusca TaxID=67352 RepID=UPI00224D7561|nr:STAS domain-containing protein [Kitasatospora purpeofusca]MCX4683207.1 STAS domain-containing protein [Kitasatospora purpeofusca]